MEEANRSRHRHWESEEGGDGGSGSGSGSGSFIGYFCRSSGPPQVVFLCMILTLSLGSTVGVVPAVMSDRYARLNHDYQGEDCGSGEIASSGGDKPAECLLGSADAQNASALESFVSNGLTFVTASLVGTISDERGRRGVMLFGLLLSLLAPACLVLMHFVPAMHPGYYYAASATTGLVNWIAVALSALSDVMPKPWRAPSFGLLLAGFSGGFAFSPLLALTLSHRGVSILSLTLLVGAFFYALLRMPETLPAEVAAQAAQRRAAEAAALEAASPSSDSDEGGREGEGEGEGEDSARLLPLPSPSASPSASPSVSPSAWGDGSVGRILMRPFRELSILNRSRLFRLLSALAFFSGMSSSADQSLLVYYIEDRLRFGDRDVAILFLILGLMGIFTQAAVLKPLTERVGEKNVVIVAFLFGGCHNIMYGLAKTKGEVFAAVFLGSLTSMSFPTISAIKSNNVEEHEQGRIQGALYSLSSLASAVGPASMRLIYRLTKDAPYPGQGSMFVFAGALYLLASFFACALPSDKANSRGRDSAKESAREAMMAAGAEAAADDHGEANVGGDGATFTYGSSSGVA